MTPLQLREEEFVCAVYLLFRNVRVFMLAPAAWTDAYLGVGANLGNRLAQIDRALVRLDAQAGVSVERVSSAYESEAHRHADQEAVPAFMNGVAHIRTALSAHALGIGPAVGPASAGH